ncbi:putative DNA repair helicase RadD [Abditibacteriota bacterium]|nr:putative DNA repair helicase RadD [Abditibacteriota bacterium]
MSSPNTQRASTLNLFDEAPAVVAIPKMGNIIEFPKAPQGRVLEDRWYQTKALDEIDARMPIGGRRRGGKGEMLVSPTGCGKTSIASRAIKRWLGAGERVLILCDLTRLLKQMNEDVQAEGIFPLIEKGSSSALTGFGSGGHKNCVLASMQSLYEGRLQKWPRDAFDKIVIDECHELKWRGIVDWFQVPYLGLTATPLRADNQSLKDFFHYPYIRTLTMREAIEGWDGVVHADGRKEYVNPFLCRIRLETIPAPQIDLSTIKIVRRDFDQAKDFNQAQLDATIYEHTNWLASAIATHSGDRPSFIYCPKIQSAEAIAKALRDIGAQAMAYTSNTPDPEGVMTMFEAGELQHLVNVNMLIKGVNVPKVSAIFRVRPSINIGQATQEIGRGTRNSPQTGKKDCVVFEFDYQTGGKKLGSVLDSILDGADDPDEKPSREEFEFRQRVRDRAESIVKSKDETDVLKAFDKAKAQLSFEDAETRRKHEEERQAKYQRVEIDLATQKYDPFAGHDKRGAATDAGGSFNPATPLQMAMLEHLSKGVIKAYQIDHWTLESADHRITELETRKKEGRASELQLKTMVNDLGMDPQKVANMKSWVASKAIDTRCQEMARALEPHGLSYEATVAKKPYQIGELYRRFCGGAS